MRGIIALLIACSLGACGPTQEKANAQPAAPAAAFTLPARPAELLGGMAQSAYVAAVRAAAVQDFTTSYGPCEAVSLRPVRFDPYLRMVDPMDPMALGIGPEAAALVWRESIEASGCGRISMRNLIAARQPGTDQPVVAPSVPGASRVSHGVVRSMLMPLAGAAGAVTTCPAGQGEDFLVVDTRITRAPPRTDDWTSPWDEEWTLRMCGQRVLADVAFTPTPATGGYGFVVRNPRGAGP